MARTRRKRRKLLSRGSALCVRYGLRVREGMWQCVRNGPILRKCIMWYEKHGHRMGEGMLLCVRYGQ